MRFSPALAAAAAALALVPGSALAQSTVTPTPSSLLTSTGLVQTNATLVNPDGSRYYAGAFTGSLSTDGVYVDSASADADAFLARVSAGGAVEWVRVFKGATDLPPGFSADAATSLASDGAGGVYVGGGFTKSLRVPVSGGLSQVLTEPASSPRASLGAFLARYDASGTAVFVSGGDGGERPDGTALDLGGADGVLSLAADGAGGVVVGGTVSGAGSFLGMAYSARPDSVPTLAVARVGSGGGVQWLRVGTSARQSSARGVAVGGDRVYAVGPYSGSLDLGDGQALPNEGGADTFIATLDLATGAVVMGEYLGGGGDVTANGIAADADGALYMTGAIRGVVSIDEETGEDSPGYVDGYVVKFDEAGNDVWVQFFGGLSASDSTYAEGMSVSLGADGKVVVSGRYDDEVAFYLDPSQPTLPGGADDVTSFAAVFSPGGTYLWSRALVATDGLGFGVGFETAATDGAVRTPLYPVQAVLEGGGVDGRVRQVTTYAALNAPGGVEQGIAEDVADLPEIALHASLAPDVDYAFDDGTGSRVRFQTLGTAQSLAVVVEPGMEPENQPSGATPVARRFTISAETTGAGVGADGFEATLTLCYLDDEAAGLDESTLALYRFDAFTGEWMAFPSTPDPATNCVTATGVPAFSPWAIAPAGAGALPVELVAFTAARDGEAVRLAWTTASETRNAGFGVEVAGPAAAWREVAFVPGAGTTAERHSYAHTLAPDAAAAVTRVRLRQVDTDGAVTYSPVLEVADAATFALGRPSPNPARAASTVSFTLPRAMRVRLVAYDALGRAVRTLAEGDYEGGTHAAAIGSDLAAGTYVLRLEGPGVSRTQTFTVVR